MGSFSVWHWLVVGILVVLLFGRGRISEMMGDVAKGIKAFRKGLADDEGTLGEVSAKPAPRIAADPAAPASEAPDPRRQG
ncbi:twin-arginine translocase TatA/TatE family subunit [Thermaurantiacus sp.]